MVKTTGSRELLKIQFPRQSCMFMITANIKIMCHDSSDFSLIPIYSATKFPERALERCNMKFVQLEKPSEFRFINGTLPASADHQLK